VITNNCEHFCEWCVHGEHQSHQVGNLLAHCSKVWRGLAQFWKRCPGRSSQVFVNTVMAVSKNPVSAKLVFAMPLVMCLLLGGCLSSDYAPPKERALESPADLGLSAAPASELSNLLRITASGFANCWIARRPDGEPQWWGE